jgi:hypothetical protein
MAFWDTYLVYNDDDFAQYLYEFPTYVADKKVLAAYGVESADIWNITANPKFPSSDYGSED